MTRVYRIVETFCVVDVFNRMMRIHAPGTDAACNSPDRICDESDAPVDSRPVAFGNFVKRHAPLADPLG
jgi:hypothetical protein